MFLVFLLFFIQKQEFRIHIIKKLYSYIKEGRVKSSRIELNWVREWKGREGKGEYIFIFNLISFCVFLFFQLNEWKQQQQQSLFFFFFIGSCKVFVFVSKNFKILEFKNKIKLKHTHLSSPSSFRFVSFRKVVVVRWLQHFSNTTLPSTKLNKNVSLEN